MRLNIIAVTAVIAVLSVKPSAAEESTRQLAEGGGWLAMAHSTSAMASADLCAAFNMKSGIAFRYDFDSMELRVVDKSWTLPSDVAGSLKLSVGDLVETYLIKGNTDTTVSAELTEAQYLKLFDKMNKAASMSISVGKAKPFAVSLTGSTRVMNAFRTCGSIKSDADGGGGNPFK